MNEKKLLQLSNYYDELLLEKDIMKCIERMGNLEALFDELVIESKQTPMINKKLLQDTISKNSQLVDRIQNKKIQMNKMKNNSYLNNTSTVSYYFDGKS